MDPDQLDSSVLSKLIYPGSVGHGLIETMYMHSLKYYPVFYFLIFISVSSSSGDPLSVVLW